MKLTLILYLFISILHSQEHLDRLIQDVLSGTKDSVEIYLPMIENRYPHNPNMLFLKGLLETNGEQAMQIFVELYNNHPTSPYGDDAVMKIAEFYYASGLYIQSAKWLKKMPIYYSRSEHIERAVKLFLNSLIVSGHRDTAIFYSRVFKRRFPNMDVSGKINALLEDYEYSKQILKNNSQSIPKDNQEKLNSSISSILTESEIDKRSRKFSLQTGAFGLHENAQKQKIYLKSGGYNARISKLYQQNKILYAVRIGYYNSSKEAEKVSNKLKSKLDLDSIVIKNK